MRYGFRQRLWSQHDCLYEPLPSVCLSAFYPVCLSLFASFYFCLCPLFHMMCHTFICAACCACCMHAHTHTSAVHAAVCGTYSLAVTFQPSVSHSCCTWTGGVNMRLRISPAFSLIPACFDLGVTLLLAFVRNFNDSNYNSLMIILVLLEIHWSF